MAYFTKSHWLKYPSFCVYFRKKNKTSTCFSKETFKLLLLQVTALYIKYTKDTMNTQYKSRLLPYDEHYIDSTELSSVLTLFRMSFFGAAQRWGRGGTKRPPLPKTCHAYPPMMRLGTFIPYLKKIRKLYESCDTPLEFCWHQHFFTGNRQILLHQKIQI